MKENFAEALEHVLKHEGGYVNHPSDPGGMTNLGVTKRVWEEWIGHEVDEKTMRALTPADVGPMYKAKYWDKVKGDELPSGVDYAVFDAAVNSELGDAAHGRARLNGQLHHLAGQGQIAQHPSRHRGQAQRQKEHGDEQPSAPCIAQGLGFQRRRARDDNSAHDPSEPPPSLATGRFPRRM